jgi:hypothetical protein
MIAVTGSTVVRGRFEVFWRMVNPSGPGQLQTDDPRKGLNTLHFYATPVDMTSIGSPPIASNSKKTCADEDQPCVPAWDEVLGELGN